jgi:hypothetical protein
MTFTFKREWTSQLSGNRYITHAAEFALFVNSALTARRLSHAELFAFFRVQKVIITDA